MAPSPRAQIGRVEAADERRLAVSVPAWPGHRPGQFAMLRLAARGECHDPLLPRPMAIFRVEEQTLDFRFKVVGRGTARLARLAVGDEIGVVGPLGVGFPDPVGPTLLVGGGTGIASLYGTAAAFPERVSVLLGGRSRAEILGLEDFRALGADLAVATEDGSLGQRGRVTDLLEPKPDTTVFACGPTPMMRRAAEIAHAVGARCHVALESQMACGFGICLGCAVPLAGDGRRFGYVCAQGPVFDAAELDWDGLP